MFETLKDHFLEEIPAGEKFKAFMMKDRKQERRMMSTLIIFTPEGIVITGDLCPRAKTRGVISDLGYGLNWFSGKLSEGYLCEKFLEKDWQKEAAVVDMKSIIKDFKEEARGEDLSKEERKKRLDGLKEVLKELEKGWFEDAIRFGDRLHDVDYEFETIPGWDYPAGDAGWLCAIQKKFAELYSKMPVPTA